MEHRFLELTADVRNNPEGPWVNFYVQRFPLTDQGSADAKPRFKGLRNNYKGTNYRVRIRAKEFTPQGPAVTDLTDAFKTLVEHGQ